VISSVTTRHHLGEKSLQNGGVPYPAGRGSSEPASLALTLSSDAFEAIVDAVVERLSSDFGASPWLTRAAAAEYLGVPVSRLEKDRRIPSHQWEGRVMYHRGELDEYLLGFGGTR
jgi:hypothetical protein